ncbi:hypothetical protein GCM10018781_02190 [Kitasatospora indigofera]|uniref:Uncharacterized protein n=1 Tax=Kitasatospora indigofera TaxID=67307 RepID=A0A919FBF1_9ACTN|nr:hypothetical protein GCM10018781_02190 [Kitasatospora indigofera]
MGYGGVLAGFRWGGFWWGGFWWGGRRRARWGPRWPVGPRPTTGHPTGPVMAPVGSGQARIP